jgi:hypothetical protein
LRSCGTRAASMLSTDSQMIWKWTAIILWQTYSFYLNKWFFFEGGRRISNDIWFILTIVQFTQIGLQQIGLKNMAYSACYIHLSYSPHLVSVTSTRFLQWKNSNGLRWLTRISSLSFAGDFEGSESTRIE